MVAFILIKQQVIILKQIQKVNKISYQAKVLYLSKRDCGGYFELFWMGVGDADGNWWCWLVVDG